MIKNSLKKLHKLSIRWNDFNSMKRLLLSLATFPPSRSNLRIIVTELRRGSMTNRKKLGGEPKFVAASNYDCRLNLVSDGWWLKFSLGLSFHFLW
jgi:hypothetical protein